LWFACTQNECLYEPNPVVFSVKELECVFLEIYNWRVLPIPKSSLFPENRQQSLFLAFHPFVFGISSNCLGCSKKSGCRRVLVKPEIGDFFSRQLLCVSLKYDSTDN
jgi:hypothetical protein